MHYLGIAHLHLTPDNVLLKSRRGIEIKLIDFTCARQLGQEGDDIDAVGTLEFMGNIRCKKLLYLKSKINDSGDPGNNTILNSDMISVVNASSKLHQYISILICHNFKACCKIQSI